MDDPRPDPAWPSLLWHVYPLGLTGADQSGARREPVRTLGSLVDWLPHAAGLGADALLLGPAFASLSHGYDTVDHRVVDERLGTSEDLDTLVEAAARYGIGVVLDGAFAYGSRRFWRLEGAAEADDPWFRRDPSGALVPSQVESLVAADHSAPGYRAYVAEVMVHWLDRGIRGWRLDSAWSVPAPFWRHVLSQVRLRHPGAWFLGQVFDDDLPPVVNRAGYSAVTEYSLMHAVREWVGGGSASPLTDALHLHAENTRRAGIAHTFVGNHDFARTADVVGPDRVAVAFALLLTLPGVPGIYYGDEFGLTSAWGEGGDDALLRPALLPDDEALTSPAAQRTERSVRELGAVRRRHPWLATGTVSDVDVSGDLLRYRVSSGDQVLEVRVNRGPEPGGGAVPVPAHGWVVSPPAP